MICQHKSFFVNTNIYSRKGNRNFPQRTPIWQRFALREEGEFAPLHTMCAPKRAQRAEKPLSSRQYVGEQRCRPQITENRRRQLAEVFVNANNLLAFPKITLFGKSPRFAAMRGLPKKSECENCFNM